MKMVESAKDLGDYLELLSLESSSEIAVLPFLELNCQIKNTLDGF